MSQLGTSEDLPEECCDALAICAEGPAACGYLHAETGALAPPTMGFATLKLTANQSNRLLQGRLGHSEEHAS